MSKHQELILPPGALAIPDSQNLSSVKLWCEYGIWGLVFYDEQSPWLTVIECLQICFHRKKHGKALFDPEETGAPQSHEVIYYGTPLNHVLRHILFRDRDIIPISESQLDDARMWKEWRGRLDRDGYKLDFRHLPGTFKNFREFAHAVELLRSAEVESHSPKRWTSRHMLPLGPAMLFPDVDDSDRLDRKFVRRTGEMLYLMLNRSKTRCRLADLIDRRLLAAGGPWDGLARRIAGPDSGRNADTSTGYLPLPSHQTYDRMADDWIALLGLQSIPVENVLDPLQRITGLVQSLYILERALETIREGQLPPFFLDLLGASGGNPVRKLSIDQCKRHRAMLMDAMSCFVDAFAETDVWLAAVKSEAGGKEARELLSARFHWAPSRPDDPYRMPSAEQQLAELREETQKTKGHYIGSTFLNCLKDIGMVRAHRRSGTWYSPTDSFLEALVLTVVTTPMEFGDFLRILFRRYNIVIGPEEVRAAFRIKTGALPAPLADLKENERRLEERLRTLGFLDRKSDDCAFVINPFHSHPSAAGNVDAPVLA
ncbi:hypothetical protein [Xanthobacter agilis]|uniref:hypothetical protein n=1 Tax=Xanthobacter agilis TaxID=47492 RepID=UPI0037290046